jgi:hypothetical protein
MTGAFVHLPVADQAVANHEVLEGSLTEACLQALINPAVEQNAPAVGVEDAAQVVEAPRRRSSVEEGRRDQEL